MTSLPKPEPGKRTYAIVSRSASPPTSNRMMAGVADRARSGRSAPTTRSAPYAGVEVKPTGLQGMSDELTASISTALSLPRPAGSTVSTVAAAGWLAGADAVARPSARHRRRLRAAGAGRVRALQPGAPELLRPLRVAGRRLPARPRGHPVGQRRGCQRLLPGHRAGARPTRLRAAAVPAAAGRAADAVGGHLGPRYQRGAVRGGAGRAQRGPLLADADAGQPSGAMRPRWAPSSTPSGRSRGTPRCWAAPGSWRTWWPARSCSWASPPRSTRSDARPHKPPRKRPPGLPARRPARPAQASDASSTAASCWPGCSSGWPACHA